MNKKNIYIMYTIAFLQGMVIYASISTLYRQGRGLNLSDIALIEAFSYIFTIALEIPFGFIADRIGYRKTLIYSNFLYFLSKIIFYYAFSFNMFLLERFFLSSAIAGLSGVDTSILYISATDEHSHKVFGIFGSFGTAGMLTGSLIFTLFLSNNFNGCALATVITYGLAFLISLSIDEVKPSNPKDKLTYKRLLSTLKITLKDIKFIIFLIGVALISQNVWNISVMLNQQKYISIGLSTQGLGIIGMIVSLVALLGAYSDTVKKKLGFRGFTYGLSIIIAISCLAMGFTKLIPICFIANILIELCYDLLLPLFTDLQNKRVSVDDRATQLSCYAIIYDLSCMAISALSSLIASISNNALFIMCAISIIIALGCINFCYTKKDPQ